MNNQLASYTIGCAHSAPTVLDNHYWDKQMSEHVLTLVDDMGDFSVFYLSVKDVRALAGDLTTYAEAVDPLSTSG